jgi:hypothetical protein
MAIQVITYRLRGGQLQPRQTCIGGVASSTIAGFYTQTFGAEKVVVDIDDAKTTLLASTDFQGQKESPDGIDDPTYIATTYSKASYQGRALRTTDGDLIYSASEEHVAEFVEEEELGIA